MCKLWSKIKAWWHNLRLEFPESRFHYWWKCPVCGAYEVKSGNTDIWTFISDEESVSIPCPICEANMKYLDSCSYVESKLNHRRF